jgi:hypothetical protein
MKKEVGILKNERVESKNKISDLEKRNEGQQNENINIREEILIMNKKT